MAGRRAVRLRGAARKVTKRSCIWLLRWCCTDEADEATTTNTNTTSRSIATTPVCRARLHGRVSGACQRPCHRDRVSQPRQLLSCLLCCVRHVLVAMLYLGLNQLGHGPDCANDGTVQYTSTISSCGPGLPGPAGGHHGLLQYSLLCRCGCLRRRWRAAAVHPWLRRPA